MPVVNGYDATRMIRAFEAKHGLPACPIIALTANAMEADRTECFEAGRSDFLSKPFRKSDLLAKLAIWSGRSSTALDHGDADLKSG